MSVQGKKADVVIVDEGKKIAKILKQNPKYRKLLATYMKTKEGQAFALSVMSQLIDGFDVDSKGKIETVHIDDTQSIKLDME